MNAIEFSAQEISKHFNRHQIFENINFTLSFFSTSTTSNSLAIIGNNGAGKSTLIKILAGILSPTKGNVAFSINAENIPIKFFHQHIGFVAPYLQLYDEFSGLENLLLFGKIRQLEKSFPLRAEKLLEQFNLSNAKNSLVRIYSSGMKQRLKYCAALLHQPEILLLDEPTITLDEEGREIVYEVMNEQRKKGLLVVATNEKEDIVGIEKIIELGKG